jgi:hypothetical protein
MTQPFPGIWFLKQQLHDQFLERISSGPNEERVRLVTNIAADPGLVSFKARFSLTVAGEHADGTRDVYLGGGDAQVYAPDDQGFLKLFQSWPADPLFQMVPTPRGMPALAPLPPRGGAFFLRFRDGRRLTYDAGAAAFRLLSGLPTADDLLVAVGWVPHRPGSFGLREGEVVFYERPNYTGAAWLFRMPFPNSKALLKALRPFQSLRLGGRTAVSIRRQDGPGYTEFYEDAPTLPDGLDRTNFFPWIVASGASAPRFDEIALYPQAAFSGRGRIYYRGPGPISLADEHLPFVPGSLAVGGGVGASIAAGDVRQETWDDLPNLIETRLGGLAPESLDVRNAPAAYAGTFALRGTFGKFWSASAGRLRAVASAATDELFWLGVSGGAFPSQRQVSIMGAAGAPVRVEGDRLSVGPAGAPATPFAMVPEEGGRFALQAADGRWVARVARDDGFTLTGDAGERQLITAIKVAADEGQVGALDEGEVAIYEHPGYWGRAWVFRASLRDFSALEGLGASIGSARLGPSTGATLYVGADFGGERVDLLRSAASLVDSAARGGAASLDVWSLFDFRRAPFEARALMLDDFRPGAAGGAEAFASYRVSVRVGPGRAGALTLGATGALRVLVNGSEYELDEHRTVAVTPNVLGELNVTAPCTDLTTPGLKLRVASMPGGDYVVIHPDEHAHRRLADLTAAELTNPNRPLVIDGPAAAALAKAVRATARTVQHNYRTATGRPLATDRRYLNTVTILRTNEYLRSANGRYYAILAIDGSLSVHLGSGPDDDRGLLWSSGPASSGPGDDEFFAAMQLDGNFCIYRGVSWNDPRDPVWATASNTPGGQFFAAVDDRGHFVVRRGTNPSDDRGPIWSSAGPPARFLKAGDSLRNGQLLRSSNGAYFATLDAGGRLSLYQGTSSDNRQQLLWAAGGGHPPDDFVLVMQPDGNLCVYAGAEPRPGSSPVWCAGVTAPGGQFYALVEDDGDLTVHRGSGPDDDHGVLWGSYEGRAGDADERLTLRPVPPGAAPGRSVEAPAGPAWRVDFGPQGSVQHRDLTHEEASALRASLADVGFVPALRQLLHDVRRGAVQVTAVAATAVSNVVHPAGAGRRLLQWSAIQVSTIEQGVLNFLLHSAEAVFDCVSLLFEAAQVTFARLRDWLKELFGWQDILRTKEAFALMLDEAFAALPPSLGALSTTLQSAVDQLDVVKSHLEELRRKLAGATVGASSNRAADVRGRDAAEGLRGRWLLSHVMEQAHAAVLPAIGQIGGDVLDESLKAKLQAAEATLAGAVEGLFGSGGLLDDPRAAASLLLGAILDAVAGLVDLGRDIAKEVIRSAFVVAEGALRALNGFLRAEIRLPFVGEVYRAITGDPGARLSPLDLIALSAAAPATIAYKALYGSPPFGPTPARADGGAGGLQVSQKVLDLSYSIVVIQWGVLDALLDLKGFSPMVEGLDDFAGVVETIAGLTAVGLTLVIQVSSTPGLLDGDKQRDFGQRLRNAFVPTNVGAPGSAAFIEGLTWDYQWLMWLVDAAVFCLSLAKQGTGKALRNVEAAGLLLDGTLGWVHEGFFLTAFTFETVEHLERAIAKLVELTAYALPEIGKFVRLTRNDTAVGGLMAIDYFMNLISGGMHLYRTQQPASPA